LRTEHALQQVCEATGARSGYLYVWTPKGFELVASHGEHAADPSLAALITSRLVTCPDSAEDATVVETSEPRPERVLIGHQGVAYRMQILMSSGGGAIARAGAVVLDCSARAPAEAELHELASSLH
jgi:hypothetical protein